MLDDSDCSLPILHLQWDREEVWGIGKQEGRCRMKWGKKEKGRKRRGKDRGGEEDREN